MTSYVYPKRAGKKTFYKMANHTDYGILNIIDSSLSYIFFDFGIDFDIFACFFAIYDMHLRILYDRKRFLQTVGKLMR